jgi:hypothetical protein
MEAVPVDGGPQPRKLRPLPILHRLRYCHGNAKVGEELNLDRSSSSTNSLLQFPALAQVCLRPPFLPGSRVGQGAQNLGSFDENLAGLADLYFVHPLAKWQSAKPGGLVRIIKRATRPVYGIADGRTTPCGIARPAGEDVRLIGSSEIA